MPPDHVPTVILDDAAHQTARRFDGFVGTVRADNPAEVPAAFAALERAREKGLHAAGYLAYELGLVLEPRLASLLPPARQVPLLWFGLFRGTELVRGAAVTAMLETAQAGRAYAGALAREWDEADYGARFARLRDYIAAGDLYQANLSFRARFAFTGDALALYSRLRGEGGGAHGAYIDDGTRRILSFSPELFFDLSAEGKLSARPMKGTAARGADAIGDARARAGLAASAKDRAENLMIVDLLRNDLGRIALIGSVRVDELFAVETYPTLHQMVSAISANLKPGLGAEAVIRALFPCGSVTGAPKIRAMEVIRELETSPRGVYCGAIGHFAPDGAMRFNVAIRTLTITGGAGELGIGGAIVQDSREDAEYAECLLKAHYYAAARRKLGLIETLGFSPASGFTHLDLHLARLARSAVSFAIPFNAEKAWRLLEELAARAEGPLRLRLTLDEEGALAATPAPMPEAALHWTYAISPHAVQSGDVLLRHKTDWREPFEAEQARLARATGCDEVLFVNERGEMTEGCRSNIFVTDGELLLTPPLSSGLLDGCLRRALLDEGRCRERILTAQDLARAEEIYLGNSLRGLVRAVPVTQARAIA